MLTTSFPPRTGSTLPSGARSVVRGAARAVVATVGAVLAGLVLALPAVHLPLTGTPAGPQVTMVSTVLSPVDHRATLAQVLAAPAPVPFAAPAAPAALSSLAAVLEHGAPWVLLAATAAAVGASRPPAHRRAPVRSAHRGPAPLRGPPAGLAPAP